MSSFPARRLPPRQILVFLGALALVFAGLTLVALAARPDAIDVAVTRWIQSWESPFLTAVAELLTFIGAPPQGALLVAIVAGLVWIWRDWVDGLWTVGTQLTFVINEVLKLIVHRDRPTAELVKVVVPVSEYSFPSGHVVEYTTLFGFAFFLVYVLARHSWRRWTVLGALAALVILIGPVRIYMGAHWFTDVLGGYTLGLFFLLVYCWAFVSYRLGR